MSFVRDLIRARSVPEVARGVAKAAAEVGRSVDLFRRHPRRDLLIGVPDGRSDRLTNLPAGDHIAWRAIRTGATVLDHDRIAWPLVADDGIWGVALTEAPADVLQPILELAAVALQRASRDDQDRWDAATLRTVLPLVSDGIMLVTTDGEVIHYNEAMESLMGWTRDEVQHEGWTNLVYVTDEERRAAQEAIAALVLGQPSTGTRRRLKRKDGSLVTAGIWSQPVPHPGGDAMGLLGLVRDETSQSEADQASSRHDQLARLGTVARQVAHDFNNLLCIIVGHADLIEARSSDPDALRYAAAQRRAVDKGAHLVRQLMASGGPVALRTRSIPLATVAKEAASLFSAHLPPEVHVEVVDRGHPVVEADPHQLHHAIVNLLTNSHQAVGAQGSIQLVAQTRPLPADPLWRSEGGPATGDRMGCLEVRDDGPGLPEGPAQRQLFEPFFTTRDDGHGVGLSAGPRDRRPAPWRHRGRQRCGGGDPDLPAPEPPPRGPRRRPEARAGSIQRTRVDRGSPAADPRVLPRRVVGGRIRGPHLPQRRRDPRRRGPGAPPRRVGDRVRSPRSGTTAARPPTGGPDLTLRSCGLPRWRPPRAKQPCRSRTPARIWPERWIASYKADDPSPPVVVPSLSPPLALRLGHRDPAPGQIEVAVEVGDVGIEGPGALEIDQGLVVPLAVEVAHPTAAARHGVVGIELQGDVEAADGLGVVLAAEVQIPHRHGGLGAGGLQPLRRDEVPHRQIVVAALEVDPAAGQVATGLGVGVQQLGEPLDRAVGIPVIRIRLGLLEQIVDLPARQLAPGPTGGIVGRGRGLARGDLAPAVPTGLVPLPSARGPPAQSRDPAQHPHARGRHPRRDHHHPDPQQQRPAVDQGQDPAAHDGDDDPSEPTKDQGLHDGTSGGIGKGYQPRQNPDKAVVPARGEGGRVSLRYRWGDHPPQPSPLMPRADHLTLMVADQVAWQGDVADVLRTWARWCALQSLRPGGSAVIRRYLRTADPALAAAALAASGVQPIEPRPSFVNWAVRSAVLAQDSPRGGGDGEPGGDLGPPRPSCVDRRIGPRPGSGASRSRRIGSGPSCCAVPCPPAAGP